MPLPILGPRRAARAQAAEDKVRAERTDLIAMVVKSEAKDLARKGKPVDVDQLVRQITTQLNPTVAVIPEEVQAALAAQGMDWQGQFAPGRPLNPAAGYGVPPRQWNYTPGRNVSAQPRSDRIPFATLKQIVEGYDVAQICIQHIINDLCSMPILFQAQEGVDDDVSTEIDAAKQFLRRPDGKRPFRRWLSMWLQDVLRYDAGCLYKQRDLAGNVISLKVIEGPTISPLVDYWGDRPDVPGPAYLQFVEGMPWDWMTAADMIYEPFTPLRESPYGLAPIECVLLNANTDVRFQWHFLQYFTEGTIPEGFAEAPPDQSDPDALADWQETWEAWLSGDQAQKHKIRWVPAGSKLTFNKTGEFNADFPEYLMRRTVAAYMLTPHDLGFTDDVNRATGDTQVDVQFRISTQPRTGYVEDILDSVLQEDLGLRVQVRFDDGREKEDRLMEAQAHQIYVNIGAESPDEVRADVLGKPVNPEEITPRFFADQRLGPLPLAYIISIAGEIDAETGAPLPGTVQPRELVLPGELGPDPLATGLPPGPDGLTAPGSTDDSDDEEDDPPALVFDPLAKEVLRKWRDNTRTRIRQGRAPRLFTDPELPESVRLHIWGRLSKATSREQVDAVFAKADTSSTPAGDGGPKAPRPGPGGHREQDLVDFWADQLAGNLTAQIDPRQTAEAWLGSNPPHISSPAEATTDTLAAAARAFSASLQLNPEPLVETLRSLYTDSWLAGAKDGLDQLATPGPDDAVARAVTGTDWDNWTPGHPPAADTLKDGGLDRMLQQARVTIKGIDDTTRTRIADILEQGVRNGDTVDEIAQTIDEVRNNPARARLIAVTEVNRAMTTAAVDRYHRAGIGMFDLVTDIAPCPVCEAIEEANPHPLGDLASLPPVHPRCRCSAAPVVEGA